MSALTLEEFKTITDLPLDQTDQDAKITLFLGMAEADYLQIMGRNEWEKGADGNPAYPGPAKRTLAEMTQFLLSGQVADGANLGGYPLSLVSGIPKYARVK